MVISRKNGRARIVVCTAIVVLAAVILSLVWLPLPTPNNWQGARPYSNPLSLGETRAVDAKTGYVIFTYDRDDGPLVKSVSKSPDGKWTVVFTDRNAPDDGDTEKADNTERNRPRTK